MVTRSVRVLYTDSKRSSGVMVEHKIKRIICGNPITLVKRDEDGYFQLQGLLPHLMAHEFGHGNVPQHWDHYQEDRLLAKYGILIETDSYYVKWITNSKAKQLIELFGWSAEFANMDEVSTNCDSEDTKDIILRGGERCNDRGSAGSATDEDEEIKRDEDKDVDLTREERVDESNGGGKRTMQEAEGREADENAKDADGKMQLEGSPLKKMKPLDSIRLFSHDLERFSQEELQLMKAGVPLQDFTSDERIKLEAFLQRILFPDGNGQPQFDESLAEVDRTYPDVPLKWDIPIDEHGNTALHWLCSIASIAMVKCLITRGADRLPGDKMGETALVKSVKSVNNYDSGTFEELLDYMYPCLVQLDESNRTVLHHIVLTSGMPGCSAAAKYYLDILMGWIVKKQSRRMIMHDEGNRPDPIISNLSLKWFISNALNAKDSNGDTCLNIASRLGNASIVEALLDYGADPYVANNSGLRPVDFGAGVSGLSIDNHTPTRTNSQNAEKETQCNAGKQVTFPLPDSNALVNKMQLLLSSISKDYEQELKEHEQKLRDYHSQLNSKREHLAASRDRLAKARQLREEHEIIMERLASVEASIKEEELSFAKRTQEMGIDPDEYQGLEEFDADEPFRIDFIYSELETKLHQEFHGDLDFMIKELDIDKIVKDLISQHSTNTDTRDIPPPVLLRARIQAYQRNEKQTEQALEAVGEKHKNLENKFRRVLSLCLKIDEEKVDGMLDGLLQAITNEDPEDIDINEMQDFLKKHG